MRIPTISVVMSCYNAERWVVQAVESVLTQSFRDFELIAINDGSRDTTPELLRSFAQADERVVAHDKVNTGLADSLNIGLGLARGVWIARLDADDISAPERLARQLAFTSEHEDIVLLGSGFHEIDQDGRVIATHSYPTSHPALLARLTHMRGFPPHSSAFFRREVALNLGGYRPQVHRAEDWDMWLRLSEKGGLASLTDPLVSIRRHAGQISQDAAGERQLADAYAAATCFFLRRSGIADPLDGPGAQGFLDWIEQRMGETGVFERRRLWVAARNRAFTGPSRARGLLGFAADLLKSGYAGPLLAEKFSGSGLPQRLAAEWAGRRQA